MSECDHRVIVCRDRPGGQFFFAPVSVTRRSPVTQEDAMFGIVSPELLITRLVIQEPLENNEAIIVEGAERFSGIKFTPKATDYEWDGDYDDAKSHRSESTGSLLSRVIAVDTPMLVVMHQYERYFLD